MYSTREVGPCTQSTDERRGINTVATRTAAAHGDRRLPCPVSRQPGLHGRILYGRRHWWIDGQCSQRHTKRCTRSVMIRWWVVRHHGGGVRWRWRGEVEMEECGRWHREGEGKVKKLATVDDMGSIKARQQPRLSYVSAATGQAK